MEIVRYRVHLITGRSEVVLLRSVFLSLSCEGCLSQSRGILSAKCQHEEIGFIGL